MTGARHAQLEAARPDASSWVAANAGSGKTRVLTERVARLLLAETDPARILCLTYTRAAAAEMQTRLFATLGAWAMAPEPDLRAALDALGEPGATLAPDRLDRARTLFARALETPGGLRIQTIHAFCEALLRRFPLEAGVNPGFAVLEDRSAKALRAETLDRLAAEDAPEFAAIAPFVPGDDPDPLLAEIVSRRRWFEAAPDDAALADLIGCDLETPPLALPPTARPLMTAILPTLFAGSVNDAKAADRLSAALDSDDATLLAALEDALLFGEGAKAPFTAKIGKFPTNATRAVLGAQTAALDALMAEVETLRARRIAAAAFERARALNRFARPFLAALDARKAARGLLDFDDLIDRAGDLLSTADMAAFVLWRLDGGLDHVLVDEAQDTSPAQWRVIAAITAEFFAGHGARDAARTVFVVGDPKQSIYSFQGAEPAAFGDMRAAFARQVAGVGRALAETPLRHSFRSAPPILELVDRVFEGAAGEGLGGPVEHRSSRPEAPGLIELWSFEETVVRDEDPPWDDPADGAAKDAPAERVATRIAATLRRWLDRGETIPGEDGRPRRLRPGDVAVLVQRRGALFEAVIRELKRAKVAVAGADVLRVGAELAVRDLLAALRVAATPGDDLALAALLRSPLGGLSERDLFRLAHSRPATLWQALLAADPAPPIRETLLDLRAQADFQRPFEMLQRLLIRADGRRALVARLGPEAEDGIDALLDLALAYESVEAPTLTGFLEWIDRDEVKAKRRSEEGVDQVRVMTVHGAKGLEFDVVILPDTAQPREGGNAPAIARLGDDARPLAALRTPAAESPPALAAAEAARRRAAEEERRRLLYVALTRAKSRLVVAGAGKRGDRAWYDRVENALRALGAEERPAPDFAAASGPDLVLARNWPRSPADAPAPRPAAPILPAWALRPPPPPVETPPTLSPSALGGAHALPGEGLDEAEARARGAALHALLETLPAVPRADWPALADRIAPGYPDLLDEAAAVLDDPALAALFAPGTLAEAEIVAALPALGGRRIRGRIDRLILPPGRVLAVDFKSNRVPPDRPEATPEGILRQMGAYAAALAALYPDRATETAILWTRSRRLMPLPPALVAAALDRARLDPPSPAA